MYYFCSVKKITDIVQPIAAELAQFEAFFEKTLHADTEPMDGIMRYVGDTSGKRLRPILVLLSAKLFGVVNDRTLQAATFVEMVHSATLIHDDVVDEAETRRNKASVKARFGNLSAVLAGDYLLAKAMLLISQPDNHDIMQEMLGTTAAMSEGELMQNASKVPEPIEGPAFRQAQRPAKDHQNDTYLDIITRKTAMLMRSCCVSGALSVNATPKQVQQIANFGLSFGILFQLRDDILDREHVEQAKALMPVYYDKTMKALEDMPKSETVETLQELTTFCAEREG